MTNKGRITPFNKNLLNYIISNYFTFKDLAHTDIRWNECSFLGWDGNVTYFIQYPNLSLCFHDVLAREISI